MIAIAVLDLSEPVSEKVSDPSKRGAQIQAGKSKQRHNGPIAFSTLHATFVRFLRAATASPIATRRREDRQRRKILALSTITFRPSERGPRSIFRISTIPTNKKRTTNYFIFRYNNIGHVC